jgi:hypothetical protein
MMEGSLMFPSRGLRMIEKWRVVGHLIFGQIVRTEEPSMFLVPGENPRYLFLRPFF